MDSLVDCVIEDLRWEAFGLAALSERAVLAAMAELSMGPAGFELCVMGCDDARIMVLNGDFRGKSAPTNVLSWPSEERGTSEGERPAPPKPGPIDMPEHLGDIAISFETCAAEAGASGKAMADHVTHLVVHGFLHLLGYDHVLDADAELMEATEVRILARMGLSDPY